MIEGFHFLGKVYFCVIYLYFPFLISPPSFSKAYPFSPHLGKGGRRQQSILLKL